MNLAPNLFVTGTFAAILGSLTAEICAYYTSYPAPCRIASKIATESTHLQDILGTPIYNANSWTGKWSGTVTPEHAIVRLPLVGPKGVGEFYGRGFFYKDAWHFYVAEAKCFVSQNMGQRTILVQLTEPPEQGEANMKPLGVMRRPGSPTSASAHQITPPLHTTTATNATSTNINSTSPMNTSTSPSSSSSSSPSQAMATSTDMNDTSSTSMNIPSSAPMDTTSQPSKSWWSFR
eukprot:TRINITY_DN17303_c0_g1::TRINITY_DN17303_c0_g1_i1::g.7761::m.7761 TRINITY_DN17303_c0_g1::TRINITY_DN17303_c0_g1_i1::g.7761  ORF type:complete len:234 (-),score=11.36,Coa1/PF08695.5/0.071,DUF167/PF02594.11/0.28 TRINITY_DN17303_c0_g1_i1:345-1046(-)